MNAIVLDTDVLSFMLRGANEFANFEGLLKDKKIVLSFATVLEIEFWFASDEKRHQFLATWKECLAKYEVHHSSTSLIHRAVSLAIHLVEKTGSKPRKHWSDIWIAATALELGIPLVTNNVKDFKKFEALGLQILSPET